MFGEGESFGSGGGGEGLPQIEIEDVDFLKIKQFIFEGVGGDSMVNYVLGGLERLVKG